MKAVLAGLCLALVAGSASARPVGSTQMPMIDRTGIRPMLMVDGAPFFMLGGEVNNSSNTPLLLPKVWSVAARLGANTVAMPVGWGQIEPDEGRYDFSFVDILLQQARAHGQRLDLVWFATWKNGGIGSAPGWVRADHVRFARDRDEQGQELGAFSPFGSQTLAADSRAFAALMRHLAIVDKTHVAIVVQVENEPGLFGLPRDHGAAANAAYALPVPTALAQAFGHAAGSWRDVFGPLAENAFMSWHIGRYVDTVAAAGKAELPLPMYVNAAVSDPLLPTPNPAWVSSGSPDYNMIGVWKIAAPHLDWVSPDIYWPDWPRARAFLDAYNRSDNPLMIPEIGNAPAFARLFWAVVGRGGIGFSPFGMDDTGYVNYPLGTKVLDAATIDAFAANYRFFAPNAAGWLSLARTCPVWGTARDTGQDQQQIFGPWSVTVRYGQWMIGDESWTFVPVDPSPNATRPVGGAAVLQLAPGDFLVMGRDVRIAFSRPDHGRWEYERVETGRLLPSGHWQPSYPLGGDQTDYGINIGNEPMLVRVRLTAVH